MKINIKRTISLALVLLFAISFGTVISAADVPVASDRITVSGDSVHFFDNDSQKSVSKSIGDKDITVLIDKENDLCICFFDQENAYRTYTLGKQTLLEVSGTFNSLTILDSGSNSSPLLNVRMASDCTVDTVTASSSGKAEVWGAVTTLNVMSEKQAVSILGQVKTLNVSSAKEIAIEKNAEVEARNVMDASAKITTFALIV
ncbi:hypothetical protein [Marasmitruncus massiliensis]|uniref:hypothetical protein n=1 Tax=Marasmitruncus massiliensis TaxID=1944642 RepID=UPI000C7D91C4|nr:hypothetical protein [Marasmitruncus massiliensis]